MPFAILIIGAILVITAFNNSFGTLATQLEGDIPGYFKWAAAIAAILDVPAAWRLIGYFCLGYPEDESDRPELERAGWEERRDVRSCVLQR